MRKRGKRMEEKYIMDGWTIEKKKVLQPACGRGLSASSLPFPYHRLGFLPLPPDLFIVDHARHIRAPILSIPDPSRLDTSSCFCAPGAVPLSFVSGLSDLSVTLLLPALCHPPLDEELILIKLFTSLPPVASPVVTDCHWADLDGHSGGCGCCPSSRVIVPRLDGDRSTVIPSHLLLLSTRSSALA
ncbi:hypothetical protein BDW60DRAFT_51247 [Aspergillus nidulans var. acristatus]